MESQYVEPRKELEVMETKVPPYLADVWGSWRLPHLRGYFSVYNGYSIACVSYQCNFKS